MAEDLGKRLVGEVEEVEVGEVLRALRLGSDALQAVPLFGLPFLDHTLRVATEGRPQPARSPPVIELMSLHSGGGATHLLYYLTGLTILAHDDGGKQCCAIILDADGRFDVDRLALHLRNLIKHTHTAEETDTMDDTILQALRHVHIFRPQSLASLTATLEALPSYLFDPQRHFSFDRPVGFIAIDSASAFYWQDRAQTEDATFYAKTCGDSGPPPQGGYIALTSALKRACPTLQCPAIFMSWYLGPTGTAPHAARSFRSSLPAPFSALSTLRLACQRIPIKKFPPLISVENAAREASDRLAAVEEGKFECFVNEWGVDERTLRRMHEAGSGFEFRVKEEGLIIEQISAISSP